MHDHRVPSIDVADDSIEQWDEAECRAVQVQDVVQGQWVGDDQALALTFTLPQLGCYDKRSRTYIEAHLDREDTSKILHPLAFVACIVLPCCEQLLGASYRHESQGVARFAQRTIP